MSMKYQRWLQSLLDDLGRGDIGVGNVELSLPRLLFTLHKGRSTLDAWLPVAAPATSFFATSTVFTARVSS